MEIFTAKGKAKSCNLTKLPYQLMLCYQSAILFICLVPSANNSLPNYIVVLSGLIFMLFIYSYALQSKQTFILGELLLYCLLFLLYSKLEQLHTAIFTFLYGMIFIGFIVLCHKIMTQEYGEK